MRGMILAAGRGLRMGVLTQVTPKPLLKVAGRCLIDYAILALVNAGIREIVINISWHAEQIKKTLGDGKQYGACFQYSVEPTALETGGGILNALPLLGDAPFVVMSSDIILLDQSLETFLSCPAALAHLLLVNNPEFHPAGDFSLLGDQVTLSGAHTLTYANLGVFHPAFFAGCLPGRFGLGAVLRQRVAAGQVTGEICRGRWWNVGTPAWLSRAETEITSSSCAR